MKGSLLIAVLAAAFAVGQAPDNSKTNQRDRGDSSATADQAKTNKADTDLAKKIRQSVYADKTLSTYAHNVKIVVQDGHVTLRGPVRTEAEADEVKRKAVDVAGAENVISQLEVAPDKKSN
jgi:hyperosmotically inducible protein